LITDRHTHSLVFGYRRRLTQGDERERVRGPLSYPIPLRKRVPQEAFTRVSDGRASEALEFADSRRVGRCKRRPGVIRPIGDDRYVHVVMPMFVQW
jgi:hypothetical protein